jgi:hypothetical protein
LVEVLQEALKISPSVCGIVQFYITTFDTAAEVRYGIVQHCVLRNLAGDNLRF